MAPPAQGWYVYGIVDGNVEVQPDTRGIGDPPVPVELVTANDVAALVSEIDLDRPVGTPDDLQAHQDILDAAVVDTAVLPLRFGAVLASRDAVATELLEPHHDEFAAALSQLSGQAQYVIRARYDEPTLLREVVEDDPEVVRLRDRIDGQPVESTQTERIRLGELVNEAVAAKRDADTQAVISRLEPVSVAMAIREPTHEEDAAHVAVLTQLTQEGDLVAAVQDLAREWQGRVNTRLLGPMAAYDFVVSTQEV
jgi:hypothetical protein